MNNKRLARDALLSAFLKSYMRVLLTTVFVRGLILLFSGFRGWLHASLGPHTSASINNNIFKRHMGIFTDIDRAPSAAAYIARQGSI